MVVFKDADLELAAANAVAHSLYNCGQVCSSVERVYVAEAVLPEFEQACAKLAAGFTVGDGLDAGSKIGPMVSMLQRDQVAAQVDAAVAGGARLVHQGAAPPGSNFYPATVLSGLKHEDPINQSETFGPVVALSSFDGSEAEAVRLANGTDYGLAAYVYSQDLPKAHRVAMGIQAGQVGSPGW